MRILTRQLGALFLASSLLAVGACSDDATTPTPSQPGSIAATVAASGDFSTLEAALEAADLTSTLAGPGPFTVFAPTDAAFAALPAGTVEALLADKDALVDLLTYHVYDGALAATDVVSADYVTMFNGAIAPVASEGGPSIAGAAISVTDMQASNGIIHVIDAVMVSPPTIAGIVSTNPDFSTLLAAVDAAGLVETLDGPGPFTVFAPNDAAFDKVDGAALSSLLADQAALTDVLLYHVADGVVPAAVAITLSSATMKNGDAIALAYEMATQKLSVNASSDVIGANVYARNGVIHVIDTVLFPPAN